MIDKISKSDRVICLGHGVPQGLIGVGMRLIIDDSFAEFFRSHANNVYIWCNADVYVRNHGLKGFATGMFISERLEARIFDISCSTEDIEKSNNLFAEVLAKNLDKSAVELKKALLEEYVIPDNHVVTFNRERFFAFE